MKTIRFTIRKINYLLFFLAFYISVGCKDEFENKPMSLYEKDVFPKKEPMRISFNERMQFERDILYKALKGGLEMENNTKNLRSQGALDTRVLVNGSILGFNKANYKQPYLSGKDNFMVHAQAFLERLDYTVSYPSGNAILVAIRNPENTYGAQTIVIFKDSNIIQSFGYKGTSKQEILPEPTVTREGVLYAPGRTLALFAGVASVEWDMRTYSLELTYYEENAYGTYFMGYNGNQKYIAGEPNSFFNPNKPTIFIVHGWQPGFVVNTSFNQNTPTGVQGVPPNYMHYWLNEGWNVAYFKWIQLADDDVTAFNLVNSEGKIYDQTKTRWRRTDGNFSTREKPKFSVLQLFQQDYEKIASLTPSNKRIMVIGNSLGGNLTMAMLRPVCVNKKRLPNRVVLTEPAYSNFGAAQGVNIPEGFATDNAYGGDCARRLKADGVALEYMRSSIAQLFAKNTEVMDVSCFTDFYPDYTWDLLFKHWTPTEQYLWAITLKNLNVANSPNVSDDDVKKMMHNKEYWQQNGGKYTVDPSDDTYIKVSGRPMF
jgi:hypothetical protein